MVSQDWALYLWGLILLLGRQCENWAEFSDTLLASEDCLCEKVPPPWNTHTYTPKLGTGTLCKKELKAKWHKQNKFSLSCGCACFLSPAHHALKTLTQLDPTQRWLDPPGGSDPTYSARDPSSIPGSGRPPGRGHGNPLQDSCLESPMDRGALWATGGGRVGGDVRWIKKGYPWPLRCCSKNQALLRSSA